MTLIIEKIKSIKNLYHSKGCSNEQVSDAKKELNLEFPDEYMEVLKEFGAISFYGTEWTGLNVDSYLNVIDITKQEREFNSEFPLDCFVLESPGIDGIIILCNKCGEVFSFQNSKIEKIHNSISSYLDECISRGNTVGK